MWAEHWGKDVEGVEATQQRGEGVLGRCWKGFISSRNERLSGVIKRHLNVGSGVENGLKECPQHERRDEERLTTERPALNKRSELLCLEADNDWMMTHSDSTS